jgi:hypothetical protein
MSGAHPLRKHLTRRLGRTPHMTFVSTLSEIELQLVMNTRFLLNLQDHFSQLRRLVDSDGRGQRRGAAEGGNSGVALNDDLETHDASRGAPLLCFRRNELGARA